MAANSAGEAEIPTGPLRPLPGTDREAVPVAPSARVSRSTQHAPREREREVAGLASEICSFTLSPLRVSPAARHPDGPCVNSLFSLAKLE